MPPGATDETRPLVVLGAGYAGLTVAHEVWSRSKGTIPTVVIDRHPVHVLRTELYEVGRIAEAEDVGGWTVALGKVFDRTSVRVHTGTVESIDPTPRLVRTDSGEVPYRVLVIALGSVPAYYGVAGAAEHTHQVYGLLGAQRLARALQAIEKESVALPGERRPRIVVIGGGSTGTELAAEIATADWAAISDPKARAPDVLLVAGALPFLAGFPPPLVDHARALLRKAGVHLIGGLNTVRVEPGKVYLEDGTVLACDAAVWCAGIEAPATVRSLEVPHGKSGRIRVGPALEVPGLPGAFALGDIAEFRDPGSGMVVPATAQAAIAEARRVSENVVAIWNGEAPKPFTYRERGVLLALGLGRGAASVHRMTIWGRPASLLKRAVQREYERTVVRGEPSGVL